MAISPVEEVMQKSTLFTNLNRAGAVCSMYEPKFRLERAREMAIRLNILEDDSASDPDPNHPVLLAILGLASGSSFGGDDIARMEAAWEYFQGKSESTSHLGNGSNLQVK